MTVPMLHPRLPGLKSCVRYDAATDWTTGQPFSCYYEEATPQTTGLTNFEGTASGYGVNVVALGSPALNSQDRIAVDGLTLEVQRVTVPDPLGIAKMAFCVRR